MSPETLQGESRPSHSGPRPRSLQATFASHRADRGLDPPSHLRIASKAHPSFQASDVVQSSHTRSKKTARYFLMHLKVVHRADRGLDPHATQNFILSGKVYFNFCAARIPNQGIGRLGS